MVKIKAIKPVIISNKNMRYDFSKDLIQDIKNEEHVQLLLNTNKFKLEKWQN